MRENEDVWYQSLLKQMRSNHGNYFLRLIFLCSPTFIFKMLPLAGGIGMYVFFIFQVIVGIYDNCTCLFLFVSIKVKCFWRRVQL